MGVLKKSTRPKTRYEVVEPGLGPKNSGPHSQPLLCSLHYWKSLSWDRVLAQACLSLRKPYKGKSEAVKHMCFLAEGTQCCLNVALLREHLKCLFSQYLLLDLGAWQSQRNLTSVRELLASSNHREIKIKHLLLRKEAGGMCNQRV